MVDIVEAIHVTLSLIEDNTTKIVQRKSKRITTSTGSKKKAESSAKKKKSSTTEDEKEGNGNGEESKQLPKKRVHGKKAGGDIQEDGNENEKEGENDSQKGNPLRSSFLSFLSFLPSAILIVFHLVLSNIILFCNPIYMYIFREKFIRRTS